MQFNYYWRSKSWKVIHFIKVYYMQLCINIDYQLIHFRKSMNQLFGLQSKKK